MATKKRTPKPKPAASKDKLTAADVRDGITLDPNDDLEEFVIDRAKWYRGDSLNALLLFGNNTPWPGAMCCVGFFALQKCGLSGPQIEDIGTVEVALEYAIPGFYNSLLQEEYEHSVDPVLNRIYEINDDEIISDGVREQRLTKAFAEIGYRPVFVGEGRPA